MSAADVRCFRWKLALNAAQFGTLLGVTGPAVEHWEAGRRKVPEYAIKLINIYKKHPSLMESELAKVKGETL